MKTKRSARRGNKHAALKQRIETALAQLAHAELVRPLAASSSQEEAAYLFKHALVVDSALSTLLRGEYKRLNLLVARALEEVNTKRLDEYAAQLAQHFAAGEDDAKTLAYATRAGDQAMRVYANTEATAFYMQALEAAKRTGATTEQWIYLYLQKGRAFELDAQYDAALESYDEMEREGERRGERALQLAARMARLPIFATPTPKYNPSKAELLASDALTLARQTGDRAAEAKTLWLKMLTMLRSMRPQDGIADGEAALKLARELNLREQLAYTLNDLGSAYGAMGQTERALALAREARDLWRELDNKPMLADNLGGTANGMIFLGELDMVIALSEEAFQISQAIGNLWGQAYSLAYVGTAHAERGDYARAIATMQDCIRYAEQAGFFVPSVQTRATLARTLAEIGAFAQAKQVAQKAIEAADKNSAMMNPLTAALRSGMYLILNDMDKAETARAQAEAVLDSGSTMPRFMQLLAIAADVELRMARGEFGRVLEVADGLLETLREMQLRLFLPQALFRQSQALLATGDREGAWAALTEGNTYARQTGSRRMRWQILADMSTIEAARGNIEEASRLRNEARGIVEYIAGNMPPEYREGFLNLPNVGAVMNAVA